MMTEATRLITPPEGTPFLAIRDEYIAICGNACRAALLSFFEGMTLFRQRKGWQDAEWVYVRLRELPALLRGIWGESTIKLEMKWLRERDFLRTRARMSANAPNEYWLNVDAVQAAVDRWAQTPSASGADDQPARRQQPARQSPETNGLGAENQPVSRIQPTGEVNLTSAPGESDPPDLLDSLKDSFLESGPENTGRESGAPAPDYDPIPFHIANGLGRIPTGQDTPLVRAVKAHPVFQAFAAGWDGIAPVVERSTASIALDACKALQADVDAGGTTLAEIEAVTRWKRGDPKTKEYRVTFVRGDTPNYRAWLRAQAKAPPRSGQVETEQDGRRFISGEFAHFIEH